MNIRALAIGAHEHYSPELRDKILDRMRMRAICAGFHLLTPTQLRALVEIESPDVPILSLYLQLSPERRASGAWRTAFNSLRAATLKPISDRRKWQTLNNEFERIAQALEDELPELARGVAFFVCQPRDLWQQTAVPLPLPDGAHLGAKAYLRPLLRTLDEQDRFVLAVLSRELSRFFISQIGQVEEVLQITADNPRKVVHDHGPRDQKDGSVLDAVGHETRIFAHAADLVLTQFEGRSLLLSGVPELRAEVMRELPKDVQQRVGEPFAVEPRARPSEIAAAARPAQVLIEAREEAATVQRLIDAGPSGSAWDVQPTLTALREGRVMTLVVDDTFARPGGRCRNCDALQQAMRPNCEICGSDTTEPVEDVAELAIEQALGERAALEMVRSAQARQMLARIGPMAAILRW